MKSDTNSPIIINPHTLACWGHFSMFGANKCADVDKPPTDDLLTAACYAQHNKLPVIKQKR